MPEYVTKSRITGRLFKTGTPMECIGLAVMMNQTYQTNEYIAEPWDDGLAADFLGASHGD